MGKIGTLYVVGTPIGNMEDITLRALRVLRTVAIIAAEDTRQSAKLLWHYDISTPLISYHQHNENRRAADLLGRLLAGDDVALVTDAGMPSISDPGLQLVKVAGEAGVTVVVVPGPTAAMTALVASGIESARFVFYGFLPRKGKERAAALAELGSERYTAIIYEAPHRLLATLRDLNVHVGQRPLAVCRELTKRFEEVCRGTGSELLEYFSRQPPRGEITLVLAGIRSTVPETADAIWAPDSLAAAVHVLESEGWDRKAALKEVARRSGVGKRDVYRAVHGDGSNQ